MAFLKTVVTPAGVPAVHEAGLAGHQLGQFEDVLASLPDIVKSGGDVANAILRTVNYQAPTIPVSTYSTPGILGSGVGGLSGTTLLLLGGGLLALLMMRRR